MLFMEHRIKEMMENIYLKVINKKKNINRNGNEFIQILNKNIRYILHIR